MKALRRFILAAAALVATSDLALAADLAPLQSPNTYSIEESDLVYTRVDGLELHARIYRPKAAGTLPATLPAIIDVHGGAWSSGDRNSGQVYDRGLASSGLFVFAIDFRQAPAHRHPAANRDIASAVRYLRSQAATLHIDPNSIGLVGSSSGGHLVMLAGLTPNSADFADQGASDASVRYVIALWPVSDPAYRYDYAKRVGRAELMRSHEAYFGTHENMERASVPRLLRASEHTHLPPLLVVQPGRDANIPLEMTFELMKSYQGAGGRLTYLFYPNQPHAFGHRASPDTSDLIGAMRDFVMRSLGGDRE
jgi:acetyl esterase/lipase